MTTLSDSWYSEFNPSEVALEVFRRAKRLVKQLDEKPVWKEIEHINKLIDFIEDFEYETVVGYCICVYELETGLYMLMFDIEVLVYNDDSSYYSYFARFDDRGLIERNFSFIIGYIYTIEYFI